MTQQNGKPWEDFYLPKKTMEHLWDSINNISASHKDAKKTLAGNISKSNWLEDKDNWFYENVLKEITEYMFFNDSHKNYFDVYIAKMKSHPKFYLKQLWVNYQKQHEFNPPHCHSGGNGFSFVVFMKIPTHYKEQHALPFSANSNVPSASNFQFLLGHEEGEVQPLQIPLSPEDEGRLLFFPAWLVHQVLPFYECEEERITVSGNIMEQEREISLEEKEDQVEDMERKVASLKGVIQYDKENKNDER